LFTLIWVLSVALGECCRARSSMSPPPSELKIDLGCAGVAVPMLLFWHLHLISRGETSIEGHDNDYFAKKAKERGVVS